MFEWVGTNTYWLVYLQDLTELAYFRGDIRKCSYTISWQDEDGLHTTYAAVRGPVETKINSAQKHGIIMNTPNYSFDISPIDDETRIRCMAYIMVSDTSSCIAYSSPKPI